MEQSIIEGALYVLAFLLVAFVSGGITAFWKNREGMTKRQKKLEQIANDVESIKKDFTSVKNCTRLTGKTYLMWCTKAYQAEGGIPLHSKAILQELADQLHAMGENGDVTACEKEINKIKINEDVQI